MPTDDGSENVKFLSIKCSSVCTPTEQSSFSVTFIIYRTWCSSRKYPEDHEGEYLLTLQHYKRDTNCKRISCTFKLKTK